MSGFSPVMPKGFVLHKRGITHSTNADAKHLAKRGAPHGTVVWAEQQSGGYGRTGSSWQSPPGNLYTSVVLRPQCSVQQSIQLGFIASLAVLQTIQDLSVGLDAGFDVGLKWPNDILVNGKKVAGLLLETTPITGHPTQSDWVILGMGLNLDSHPKQTRYPASDLKTESRATAPIAVDKALSAFLEAFDSLYKAWQKNGFVGIRKEWLAHHVLKKSEAMEVRLYNKTLRGAFYDLSAEGYLLLHEESQGIIEITSGDIFGFVYHGKDNSS